MKDLVELVQDDERLKDERKRAKKNRDKYKGVSSDDFSRNYSKILSVTFGMNVMVGNYRLNVRRSV